MIMINYMKLAHTGTALVCGVNCNLFPLFFLELEEHQYSGFSE